MEAPTPSFVKRPHLEPPLKRGRRAAAVATLLTPVETTLQRRRHVTLTARRRRQARVVGQRHERLRPRLSPAAAAGRISVARLGLEGDDDARRHRLFQALRVFVFVFGQQGAVEAFEEVVVVAFAPNF